MLKKFYKFYLYFKENLPQFRTDGLLNLYIIKAGGNSKGSGIQITNNDKEAI